MAQQRPAPLGSKEAAARATWNTSQIMADPSQTPWQRLQWAEREREQLEAAGCLRPEAG